MHAAFDKETLLELDRIQVARDEWASEQFGETKIWHAAAGIWEESGELAHAYLKSAQNIRGTASQHRRKAMDAIGDIFIFTAALASCMNVSVSHFFSVPILTRGFDNCPHHGLFLMPHMVAGIIQECVNDTPPDARDFATVQTHIAKLFYLLNHIAVEWLDTSLAKCVSLAWEEIQDRTYVLPSPPVGSQAWFDQRKEFTPIDDL